MKKSLADRIEQYLKVLIERSDDHQIEIQRSELAETFGCVPSQVTYVISTRFTETGGYNTESRRGGKGFVRISKYYQDNDCSGARSELIEFVGQLLQDETITASQSELLQYLIDHTFRDMALEYQVLLFQQLRKVLADYVDE